MSLVKYLTLCLLIISGTAHSNDSPFTVGFTPLYPFIWESPKGSIRGIYVDILTEALERRLGIPVKYKRYPPLRLEHSLESGKIDAFVNINLGKKGLKAAAKIPIAVGMMGVFTHKNHPRLYDITKIDVLSDIQNLTVLAHHSDHWADTNLKKYAVDASAENYTQVLKKLAMKRGDITLIDEIIGLNTIRAQNLSHDLVLASRLTTDPILHQLLISPKSTYTKLASKLTVTMLEVLNDGTMSSIYKKYRKPSDFKLLGMAEKNKVRLAHYTRNSFNQIADTFNKTPHEIKIKPLFLEVIPYKDTIRYALLSQSPPELIMTWAGYRTQFLVDNQLIVPLNAPQESIRQYDKASISNVSYNGEIYARPWNHHIVSLIYNKRLLEKHNIKYPKSWREMFSVCDRLVHAGIVPFTLVLLCHVSQSSAESKLPWRRWLL